MEQERRREGGPSHSSNRLPYRQSARCSCSGSWQAESCSGEEKQMDENCMQNAVLSHSNAAHHSHSPLGHLVTCTDAKVSWT